MNILRIILLSFFTIIPVGSVIAEGTNENTLYRIGIGYEFEEGSGVVARKLDIQGSEGTTTKINGLPSACFEHPGIAFGVNKIGKNSNPHNIIRQLFDLGATYIPVNCGSLKERLSPLIEGKRGDEKWKVIATPSDGVYNIFMKGFFDHLAQPSGWKVIEDKSGVVSINADEATLFSVLVAQGRLNVAFRFSSTNKQEAFEDRISRLENSGRPYTYVRLNSKNNITVIKLWETSQSPMTFWMLMSSLDIAVILFEYLDLEFNLNEEKEISEGYRIFLETTKERTR